MATFSNYLGKYNKKIVRSYNFLSFMLISKRWSRLDFLNLGYIGYDIPFKLNDFDEKSMHSIALYCKALEKLPAKTQSALEIGSGLGGGCYLMKNYFNIKEVVGIDYAKFNVRYSSSKFSKIGIRFLNLPAEESYKLNQKFDIILSLEASQLFYSWELFIKNIPNLLNKNGAFFYADIFAPDDKIRIENIIADNGLKIIYSEDISDGVSMAIEKIKKPEVENFIISLLRRLLFIKEIDKFHAYNNSDLHNKIKNKELLYTKYIIVKK